VAPNIADRNVSSVILLTLAFSVTVMTPSVARPHSIARV
jgi:hypothetical protein